MIRCYITPDDWIGPEITLSPEESRHLLSARRAGRHETLEVFNGNGASALARILGVKAGRAVLASTGLNSLDKILCDLKKGDNVVWQVDSIEDYCHFVTPYIKKALKDKLADPKFDGVHIAITFGDAGQEVAEFAQSVKAGLIVMPSHGRTGLKHLLIGSVAERVVRLAHCPVLVLRD